MDTFSDARLILPLLHEYGKHSLAYSLLQPGMRFFGNAETGALGFRAHLGHAVVLGDPLCAAPQMDALLDAFIARWPRVIFMQVQGATAERLRARGLRVLPVGVEMELDPREFHLRGRRKQDLRHYRNKARQARLVVREEPDSAGLREELLPLSNAWLAMKSRFRRELRFLARPYVLETEPGARIFVARQQGTPLGFVVLDPMYQTGACLGYSAALLRQWPGAPEGTLDYVNLRAIKECRREGLSVYSLGVCPFYRLAEIAQEADTPPWAAFWLYRTLFRFGGFVYHFHGLTFHKSRYRGREIPVYSAFRGPLGLLPNYAAARACRML